MKIIINKVFKCKQMKHTLFVFVTFKFLFDMN